VLRISGTEVVLWLHIIAASVWIGGQMTVAAVIPALRHHPGLARSAGNRYQIIAWPAYVVLVLTGIANVGNAGLQWSHLLDSAVGRTLAVKLGFVGLSGLAAAVHAFLQAPRRSADATSRPVASALLGSISLLAALVAALYGVAIANA
jgi:putative copper export protein